MAKNKLKPGWIPKWLKRLSENSPNSPQFKFKPTQDPKLNNHERLLKRRAERLE